MGVRAYIRSPIALTWTLIGIFAVSAVAASGWQLIALLGSMTAIADPAFLGGFGIVFLPLVVSLAAFAIATVVWLPCSAAIAYTVGRRSRNAPVSFSETTAVVRSRSKPLFQWLKTTVAIGSVADRLLTDTDVSPAEVAIGCRGFVVPALVLDAPTLPLAVDRANRVIPQPGRHRPLALGVGTTAMFAAVLWGVSVFTDAMFPASTVSPSLLGAGVVLVGVVITAALDTAWRADVYASADLDAGFSR